MKNLADPVSARKPVSPGRVAGSERAPSSLARFATLAGGGAILMTTAQFGRSPVRQTAYRLCERRPDLDLKLSWRLFASLADWGKRWPAEQAAFAAGLILSAANDPAVDRAVGRCLADLARLGRPVLWGVVGPPVRWRSRFALTPNGWAPEEILPDPFEYARLRVAYDTAEFRPRFDPILYAAEPDFSVSGSYLCWWEGRHFHWVMRDGKRVAFIGCMPDG
ncbi:MAG TPA: hypothetical protein VKG79_10015 [Bryobacteraceae bacterium]|nr:hypothetical protein [Bryobacteraceae bacterium]